MGDCESDLGLDYKPPQLLLLLEEEEDKKKKEEIKSPSSSSSHDRHATNIETLVEDLQNLSLKGNENIIQKDHVTSFSSSTNETLEGGGGGELELQNRLSSEEERSGETLEGGGVETKMISQFSTNLVRFFRKEKNDDNPVVASHDCSTTIQTTLEKENLSLEQGKQNHPTPDDAASDDDAIKTQTLDVNPSSEWNGTPKKDDHHPTTIQTLDGELHNPSPTSEWDKLPNPEVETNPPPSSEWNDGWDKDNPEVEETNLSSEWVVDGTQKDNPEEDEEEETIFKEERRIFQYPLRPEEPDCVFYLRTGSCRYGFHCKFNHPPRKKHQLKSSSHLPVSSVQRLEPIAAIEVVKEKEWEREDFTEGKIECKYHRMPGGCKFGKACRYYHPQERKVVGPPTEFNFLGLPIRPGERKCPFFMRTGSCKFATSCKFHHPDPTDAVESDPLSGYHGAESVELYSESPPQPHTTSWSLPETYNETAPYMDTSSSYPTRMVSPYNETARYMDASSSYPNRERNGYQVPVRYSPEGNRNPQSASLMNHSTRKTNNSMHQQQQMVVDEFPERPGQQECQYYMKYGDCKYRSACRFHHPKNYSTNSPVLSSIGLPLRPGQITCSNYSRFGICKYGPSCKFDHPEAFGNL